MSGIPHDPVNRPELTALEGALRELAPRPAALNRDVVLFRAGQRTARSAWPWQCATAITTAASLILGVMLAFRPPPIERERIVYLPAPIPPVTDASTDPRLGDDPVDSSETDPQPPAYQTPQRRLQEHLLRWGFDGLGTPVPDPDPDLSPTRSGTTQFYPFTSLGE